MSADALRALFEGGPDTPCRTTWRDGIECVEVPLDELRAALLAEIECVGCGLWVPLVDDPVETPYAHVVRCLGGAA